MPTTFIFHLALKGAVLLLPAMALAQPPSEPALVVDRDPVPEGAGHVPVTWEVGPIPVGSESYAKAAIDALANGVRR